MRRIPNEDETFAALTAFWNEFQRWRVLACAAGDRELHKAIRDQMPADLSSYTAEEIVAAQAEPIEYQDFSDHHAARSYIQFLAMKAALTCFASSAGKGAGRRSRPNS